MHRALTLALIVLAAASCRSSDEPPRGGPEVVSALALPDTQGRTFDPSRVAGKRLLVNVWSVSCSACIHEMPELQAAVDADPNAALVLVTLDGRPERAERTARANRVTAPVLMADRRFIARANVRATPTTFVVDVNGNTERVLVGQRSRAGFERALRGD